MTRRAGPNHRGRAAPGSAFKAVPARPRTSNERMSDPRLEFTAAKTVNRERTTGGDVAGGIRRHAEKIRRGQFRVTRQSFRKQLEVREHSDDATHTFGRERPRAAINLLGHRLQMSDEEDEESRHRRPQGTGR